MGKIKRAKTQRVPISKMNPAPYNPRKMNEERQDGLRESLERFGMVEDVVWNVRSGNIVGGHQRFCLLVADGAKTVDAKVVDLNDADEKALNLALNNAAIQGEFTENVRVVLDEIRAAVPDLPEKLRLDEIKVVVPRVEVEGDDGEEAITSKSGSRYNVIVECADEGTQVELIERLVEEGFKCRALTS